MKKIAEFLKNSWESVTDGQKGSVIDVIKILISWIKLFWNAVSSQLNAILNNDSEENVGNE